MLKCNIWNHKIDNENVGRNFLVIDLHSDFQGVSLAAQLLKNTPEMQETLVRFLVEKIPWRRHRLPTPIFLGLPDGSVSKEFSCNAGDLGLIPRLGQSSGGGHGNPHQYSCLENPHGQRRLVGYTPWGCKESDTIEWLSIAHTKYTGNKSKY